ncbi:hypothetical protein CIW48_29505 [Methylobacterium sp. P1-11]|nr:hypothetical protein CIW48_29505 [Methylobacterium sp. P1-11]
MTADEIPLSQAHEGSVRGDDDEVCGDGLVKCLSQPAIDRLPYRLLGVDHQDGRPRTRVHVIDERAQTCVVFLDEVDTWRSDDVDPRSVNRFQDQRRRFAAARRPREYDASEFVSDRAIVRLK